MEQPEKKQLITLIFALAMSSLLCLFSTGFFFVFTFAPKVVALALGFSALKHKKRAEFAHGIYFGYTMFSILFTIVLGFRGWFCFILAVFVLAAEVMSLIYSGKLATDAAHNRQAQESIEVDSSDEEGSQDIVEEQHAVPYGQSSPQQPQVFQEVYPSQPQQQPPQIYHPQPQVFQQQEPAPVQTSDEHLFQKFSVQLALLSEMSFQQNYNQKVRNARLLEKYNGNIQNCVSELVQSS